jgi:uncharacterized protein YprB with RNaseH-like and TPR domain
MPALLKRNCRFCGDLFETKDARKVFCSKQHADRSRNGTYKTPAPVTWENIEDLRHFGKLSQEGKRRVLLGESRFSVVVYDIEATHLKANVGRVLCCSFKPLGKKVYTFSALDPGMRAKDTYDDSRLVTAIRDELEKFDIIVGHNSKEFDTKYINARCLRAGERIKKAQYQADSMWAWRSKAAAWSGLNSVQQFVLPDGVKKTSIAWDQWMRALGWDKQLRENAMAEIIDHCEKDVIVLENVYRVMVEADVFRSLRKDGGVL